MTQDPVSLDYAGPVALIGLDRPDKRNAISDTLLAALEARLVEAQQRARAIVVFGHGPCFCAGLDLSEHRSRTAEEVFHHSRGWHRVFRTLREGPVPAIAAVHGACVGGGLELAAACHIRVADTTAVFALPEGTRGIFVGGGATVHVARLLGAARMTDMMLTGRTLDAVAAERVGLVTYVEPAGEALVRAREVAARVAEAAPLTVMGVLQALPRIQDMAESDGLFVESLVAALAQTAPEAERRLAAFLEKRAPKAIRPQEPGE
ncbi:crotonase/enoyl-CoA hydratase family protein [Falsiroseomonas oryziterrae]|uniref:crotonase/enoyl-CoA hydratase family protein n=1 Tax=Falsiroseomonas oryziterrae TaxID=2911368 RepID=UPI001F15DEF2|nr:crotonase/enoyl-CoA hydratase family protein [Roseomonas sp. NPKOSM-4]